MLWLAAALLAGLLLVRVYEAKLAFFPTRGEDATPASYGIPFTPLTAPTADGQKLRVWHLTRPDAQAQVVYFHGNGGNLSLWSDILVELTRHKIDVIAFDYRGYGASTGVASESGLYQDVDAVVSLTENRLRRKDVPLVYWGRSLGTTMAAYAASRRSPGGIILESGFASMRDVVRSSPILWALSFLSSYEFPTARFLLATKAPVLVIHGDADTVIPFAAGQTLYQGLSGPKQFVAIKGGDHNDAVPRDPDTYWRAVEGFLSSLSVAHNVR